VLGSATAEATRLTGMEPLATELVSYALGVGLLAIGLAAIWRTPQMSNLPPEHQTRRHFVRSWLVTLFLIVLWVVWVAGAMRLFWLLAIAVLTPIALGAVRRLTRYLFLADKEEQEGGVVSTSIIIVDAMLRAIVVGIALWILADAWEISFSQMTAGDDPDSKVARALLKALVILFAFDALWQFTRTVIDLKIARVDETAAPGSLAGIRQAKLRTLLPVARNFAMVFFATLAALMTLSTLGIEIGPLVASAGVVGLAIGFGAQTLVKDVISGIFYLLDDAFRVGEYIISGSFKGTVETFSLRSVRLRHQNGPVYTVPFSLLGAVQNVSRDYAVDKILITVSYDTDLEKARKLIKQVGENLMEDPELMPVIIEPLKMQAVSDFGTYGIQLKLRTTMKPGFQSIARKKAFPLIKKAFDENGIEFARPVVKVAEGQGAAQVAAGQQILTADMTAPAVPPPA
jgi:small-conductance mechanosensitive channel